MMSSVGVHGQLFCTTVLRTASGGPHRGLPARGPLGASVAGRAAGESKDKL